MKPRTLKALKGYIRKWEGIVLGTVKNKAASNCPLCKEFLEKKTHTCSTECPVVISTGSHLCRGTPYYLVGIPGTERTAETPEQREAAFKELQFLRSLLPKAIKR